MNRRSFLAQATAAGSLSATGIAPAAAEETESELIHRALESEKAQSILEALGHPAPDRVNKPGYGRMGPLTLMLDKASVNDVTFESGRGFTNVNIPTEFGELGVSLNNNRTITAVFNFDYISRSHKNRLKDIAGDIGFKEGTDAVLINSGGGVGFLRQVSEEKQQVINTSVKGSVDSSSQNDDEKPQDVIGFAGPHGQGYRLVYEDRIVTIDENYSVVSQQTPENGISAQDNESGFYQCAGNSWAWCVTDIHTIASSCGLAGGACYFSVAAGPLAIPACIAAFTLICGPAVALFQVSGSCWKVKGCPEQTGYI